jgi:hypothetical protein
MRSVVRVVLALSMLAGSVLASPAQEQPPLVANGDTMVLSTLGQSLSTPVPDWLEGGQADGANPADSTPSHYVADDREALLELYPPGETQALWTQNYGIRLARNNGRSLGAIRSAVMASYARVCDPALTGFFQLGADQGEVLAPLGYVCGAFRRGYTGLGGKGEVMVMSFRQNEAGVAMVFRQWRGPAFNPEDPQSWPVATQDVQDWAETVRTGITLTPAD